MPRSSSPLFGRLPDLETERPRSHVKTWGALAVYFVISPGGLLAVAVFPLAGRTSGEHLPIRAGLLHPEEEGQSGYQYPG